MNATIEKIVGLLFEELQETEETRAIREEVLRNCTERYQDLLEAGMSEDDAISAVVESLHGMEEMLADYPRKPQTADACEEEPFSEHDEQSGYYLHNWLAAPAQTPIREIHIERMGCAEVTVKTSEDESVHVKCESDNPETDLLCAVDGGVVTIALTERVVDRFSDFAKTHFGKDGIGLSDFSRIVDDFISRVATTDAFSGDIHLTLYLPECISPVLRIHASDGSICVMQTALEQLDVTTVSGDITVDHAAIRGELRMTAVSGALSMIQSKAGRAFLLSTSGDIDMIGSHLEEKARLTSTSGDIAWLSTCRQLEVRSVSGDLEVRGSAESITFRTVSGDAEIFVQSDSLQCVKGKTVSGDAVVTLPEGKQAEVRCSSAYGSITTHVASIPSSPLLISVASVSGDIEVK